MASEPPRRPISLAQLIDENLDGEVTLDETIANTDGTKVQVLDKPLIVHKDARAVNVGGRFRQKKLQFLDAIMHHNGKFDFKELQSYFFNSGTLTSQILLG